MPRILDASDAGDIDTAAAMLTDGLLVALPTETVYGLGADAGNESAVSRIFAAKGRPADHPLIVHVDSAPSARALAGRWTDSAEILARRFWPGPLSILLSKSDLVPMVVTGSRPTVVVRVPDHPATLRVLRLVREHGSIGIAAPSANKFGAVSPTTAQHVLDDLGDSVDAILDGGPCSIGVESTIVDCTSEVAVLLRSGGVPSEAVSSELALHGLTLVVSGDAGGTADPSRAVAPGMLVSHYAPRAAVEVFATRAELEIRRRRLVDEGRSAIALPYDDDTYVYSRNLYATLREIDAQGCDVILALLPSSEGLGAAVRDRLMKASAAR